MQINNLEWLQKYYLECCNGDWEHTYGIKLDTLDNPGWTLLIDLDDTMLENEELSKIKIERSEHDWIICKVENKKYDACGGPENLTEMIRFCAPKI